MKKQDFYVIGIIGIIILVLIQIDTIRASYLEFNKNHGLITSFIKFGVLATFGEMLALRIKTGSYLNKEFGVIPKFIIWGLIGLTIKAAFVIFISGTHQFLAYLGFLISENASMQMQIVKAFCISVAINVIYAPVMMTFHKITDLHIEKYDGKLNSLIQPIRVATLISNIDWKIMWGFVFKKTIPLFWIPMHTITFMLPQEFQVLFAAFLSIMLGLILSIATLKSQN